MLLRGKQVTEVAQSPFGVSITGQDHVDQLPQQVRQLIGPASQPRVKK
jgi:hypothetical protein